MVGKAWTPVQTQQDRLKKHWKLVVLKAKGSSVKKAVDISKGIKECMPFLYQKGLFSLVGGEEKWDSFEEGLDVLDNSDKCLMISIYISTCEMENIFPKFQRGGPLYILSEKLLGEIRNFEFMDPNTSAETILVAIFYDNCDGIFCATDSMSTTHHETTTVDPNQPDGSVKVVRNTYRNRKYGKFVEVCRNGNIVPNKTNENGDVYMMVSGCPSRLTDLFKDLIDIGNVAAFSDLDVLATFCDTHFRNSNDLKKNAGKHVLVCLLASENEGPAVRIVDSRIRRIGYTRDYLCRGSGSTVISIGVGNAGGVENYDICLPDLLNRTYEDAKREAVFAVALAKKRLPFSCGGKTWVLKVTQFGCFGPEVYDEDMIFEDAGPELLLHL